MDASKHITLVIPCWNRQGGLNLLIRSLQQLKALPRVIIIDDYSNPPLESEIGEIVRLKERLGTSAAKNIGLALCETKYIWFLDSDTEIINPDMLTVALGCLEADERIAVIGGEICLGGDGRKYLCEHKILPDYSTFRMLRLLEAPVVKEARLVITCNSIMRADALREVGGFCTHIKIHEDKLACFLLRRKGYKVLLNSDVAVVHYISLSGRIPQQDFWNEYASNSAFVFGALSGRIKIRMFPVYTLLSRAIEILGMPKLLYDYMRTSRNAGSAS